MGKSQESAPLKHQFLLPLDFHVDLNRLGSTFLRDPSINMFRVYDEEDQNPNYTNNNENYETFARNENYENADDEIINNVAIDDKIENVNRNFILFLFLMKYLCILLFRIKKLYIKVKFQSKN